MTWINDHYCAEIFISNILHILRLVIDYFWLYFCWWFRNKFDIHSDIVILLHTIMFDRKHHLCCFVRYVLLLLVGGAVLSLNGWDKLPWPSCNKSPPHQHTAQNINVKQILVLPNVWRTIIQQKIKTPKFSNFKCYSSLKLFYFN